MSLLWYLKLNPLTGTQGLRPLGSVALGLRGSIGSIAFGRVRGSGSLGPLALRGVGCGVLEGRGLCKGL